MARLECRPCRAVDGSELKFHNQSGIAEPGGFMGIALTLAIAVALAATEEPAPSSPAAPPTSAPAAEAKVRAVVHLRDGGLVRGTVKKMRLGKSITLTLASGKSITLDDEDVVEIQIYGRGAPADASAGPSPTGAAAKGETFPAQPVNGPKAASAWPTATPARSATAPAADSSAAASRPSGASARPAPLAQPTPGSLVDTVYLAGGGLVRGTVESEKPDLVIRLLSGRKRTIAAAEVKSIQRHGASESVDTAWLSDGTVLRGAIESEKPDLVIRLLSGKKRTVPAASVQRVERGRKP